MTPERFDACLTTIGWPRSELARRLRCDTNLPTRWGRGDAAIPTEVAAWLERLARFHERYATPADWRRRALHTKSSLMGGQNGVVDAQ
jgi:ribosome-binding protein aMBF1 (putative translation factor)